MSSAEQDLGFRFEHPGDGQAENSVAEVPAVAFFNVQTDTQPDMERIEHAAKDSSEQLVMTVLEEIGLVSKSEVVEQHRSEAQQIWKDFDGVIPEEYREQFRSATQIVRLRDVVAEHVKTADEYQKDIWWSRQGDWTERQKDAINDLFEKTGPYEESTLLKTFDHLYFRLPGNTTVQVAKRIARVMLQHEAEVQGP